MLAEKRPPAAAAIASALCAELYTLEILEEKIEDTSPNLARFMVLSKEASAEGGDKCSLTFITKHKPGTLFKVIETFAVNGINLTRIESLSAEPGANAFLLDFSGSIGDEKVRSTLDKIEKITHGFRLLGCYREISAS